VPKYSDRLGLSRCGGRANGTVGKIVNGVDGVITTLSCWSGMKVFSLRWSPTSLIVHTANDIV
jgi:hypothetical protein